MTPSCPLGPAPPPPHGFEGRTGPGDDRQWRTVYHLTAKTWYTTNGSARVSGDIEIVMCSRDMMIIREVHYTDGSHAGGMCYLKRTGETWTGKSFRASGIMNGEFQPF